MWSLPGHPEILVTKETHQHTFHTGPKRNCLYLGLTIMSAEAANLQLPHGTATAWGLEKGHASPSCPGARFGSVLL